MPTDFPSIGVPWLLQVMTALSSRVQAADRLPGLANVAISNVPGPAVPLYLAGAHMRSFYPASIVTHGLALIITVQSYENTLDMGLMACASAMPDVRELAAHVRSAFAEFQALEATAPLDESTPQDAKSVPKSKPASRAGASKTGRASR
jgi:hypothetical protein